MLMTAKGSVVLVGAGPGDPGLLTLAGRQALAEADVVLYDRLAGDAVLAYAAAGAQMIDVGKNSGCHPTPQEKINQLILDHALAGRKVVRLKGGDPYLFGRGAEELELLRRHSVRFRVIPGVTSAIAVPAYAGIPVTHREYASSLHILTGHGKQGSKSAIPFAELVRLKGTLVFLMAFATLEEICQGLLQAGLDPAMPAALVENGTQAGQKKLVATVATLPALAAQNGSGPPAVLVVGLVAALSATFDWTSFLPLWGRRVLVASTKATGNRLAEKLRAAGAAVDELPCLVRTALPQTDAFWRQAQSFAWIVFTSAFGIEAFFAELARTGLDIRKFTGTRFAVVGEKTAAALAAHGVQAAYMPARYDGAALAEGLLERLQPGETVLLYRAKNGARELAARLAVAGVAYDDKAAYETVSDSAAAWRMRENLAGGAYDAAVFASGSAAAAFAEMAAGLDVSNLLAACIGETTAGAARAAGMAVRVSSAATSDSLVELLLQELGDHNESHHTA